MRPNYTVLSQAEDLKLWVILAISILKRHFLSCAIISV